MNDLQIDTAITYSQNLLINKPFIIKNNSNSDYAFKIKTNQKNLLSMHINHGFLKSHNSLVIPIKIVEQPEPDVTIKLEVNWCVATQQMIKQNDSKMTKIGKDQIKKKVFAIQRQKVHKDLTKSEIIYTKNDEQQQLNRQTIENNFYKSFSQDQLYQSVYQGASQNNQPQIRQKPIYNSPQNEEKKDLKDSVKIQQTKNSEQNHLQVVSEEDQEDHERQLQTIKNEIINEKRLLDQVKVKVRKIQNERSSKQLLDFRVVFLILLGSYLFGSFLKYLF